MKNEESIFDTVYVILHTPSPPTPFPSLLQIKPRVHDDIFRGNMTLAVNKKNFDEQIYCGAVPYNQTNFWCTVGAGLLENNFKLLLRVSTKKKNIKEKEKIRTMMVLGHHKQEKETKCITVAYDLTINVYRRETFKRCVLTWPKKFKHNLHE